MVDGARGVGWGGGGWGGAGGGTMAKILTFHVDAKGFYIHSSKN